MATPIDDIGAQARLRSYFESFGLTSFADRAWQMVKDGADLQTILLEMRKTPEWRDRFGIAYDAMAKAGTAVDEGMIIQYERDARGLMRQYGMPAAFQDYKTLQKAMANNVSLAELRDRLVLGEQRAMRQPPSVLRAYSELFGADGRGALTATMFLEFDDTLPELEQKIAQAEVLGRGRDLGFEFGRDELQQFTQQVVESDQIRGVLGQIDQQRSLFQETVGEAGQDLRAEREGVQAALGTSSAGSLLERRRQQRIAATRANVGSGSTEKGSLGYGTAND